MAMKKPPRIKVPRERQRRRGRRDQDARDPHHGDRQPQGRRRQEDPARHHPHLHRDVRRPGGVLRRARARDRRQPLHRLLPEGARARRARARPGSTTPASARWRRFRSMSLEIARGLRAAAAAVAGIARCARHARAPAQRRPSATARGLKRAHAASSAGARVQVRRSSRRRAISRRGRSARPRRRGPGKQRLLPRHEGVVGALEPGDLHELPAS